VGRGITATGYDMLVEHLTVEERDAVRSRPSLALIARGYFSAEGR